MSAALLGIVAPEGVSATIVQDPGVHAAKVVFAEAESWPAVAPGQHPIRNFEPFRAVYERVYRDANGRQRQDRVIITAERVAWGPTSAIAVTLIDTGNLDFDDTFARVHTRIFAEDDQRMLFQISPAPGSARDYLVINTGGPTARATGFRAQRDPDDSHQPITDEGAYLISGRANSSSNHRVRRELRISIAASVGVTAVDPFGLARRAHGVSGKCHERARPSKSLSPATERLP